MTYDELRDVYEAELGRLRTTQPECPRCGRVMSWREHDEQGACNDCYGDDYDHS